MCGRFNQLADPAEVGDFFHLPTTPSLFARYNIAPSQPIAVVGLKHDGRPRALSILRWGWQRPGSPQLQINVKSETADRLPMFADAFRRRRCLIPATGFYEWATVGRHKKAHHFRLKSGGLFALAGLFDVKGTVADALVLTTKPNAMVKSVHNRMPVMLARDAHAAWLDPATLLADLKALLGPFPAAEMDENTLGPAVNSPRNDGPEC